VYLVSEIPQSILRLPLLADLVVLSCECLPEGRTNHNYRVDVGDRVFFVRLNASGYGGHGIDRRLEYAAIETLYAAGLGPAPVCFDAESQIIVTEFLDVPTWTLDKTKTPAALALFGRAIAVLHGLADSGAVYDVAAVSRRYIANLRRSSVAVDLDFLARVCIQVEELVDPGDLRMCHNDLWYGNFLDVGGVGADEDGLGVKLVDLEMAGRGDLYFDLVCFVQFHGLDAVQTRSFLEAYAERSGFYPSTQKLDRMRAALYLRECLWAFTQIANGFTDPFYVDYGVQQLKALSGLKG
jgi:thiamine kinase-like enzyme